MTKIEKILRQKLTQIEYDELGSLEELIKRVSIEYAIWYAKEALIEYDELLREYNLDSQGLLDDEFQLPEHE